MSDINDQEFRCYHFNNFYLSGIHAGIQAAHAQHELAYKYLGIGDAPSDIYENWVENHKTMVVLNGGMAKDLLELEDLFDTEDNPYPWASWRESEEALNGCITSIAMVLPQRVFANNQLIGNALMSNPGYQSVFKTRNPELSVFLKNDGSVILENNEEDRVIDTFSDFEVKLMMKMSQMKLM